MLNKPRITASDWLKKYLPERKIRHKKIIISKVFWVFLLTFFGLVPVGALYLIKDTALKRQIEDYTFGVYSSFWRNVPVGNLNVAFTLFGVTRETIDGWEQPSPRIRRDRLKDLVRIAVDGGATAVVLDVGLDGEEPGNNELYEYLASLNNPAGTPVFLVRDLLLDEPSRKEAGKAGGCRMARRTMFSALDSKMDSKTSQIHWVTATIGGNPRFLTAQYLTQYERVCTDTVPRITPSVFLAMSALIDANGNGPAETPAAALADLTEKLTKAVERHIPQDSFCSKEAPEPISLANGRTILLDQSPCRTGNWIRFTLPWLLEKGELPAMYGPDRVPVVDRKFIDDQTLKAQPSSQTMFRGRIVVIGAADQGSGDIKVTPLGWMPGTMVIINALHSQINLPEFRILDKKGILALELFISFLASVGAVFLAEFARRAFFVNAVIIVSCCVIIPGAAVYIWGAGLWMDVTAPAISAFIHHKILHAVLHRFRHRTHGASSPKPPLPAPAEVRPVTTSPEKADISTTQL
ncbi:hypothetical protein AZL_a08660 (plasmid) [Azospirillum sp. B510]|uniref:CHASE2 domain-containing protein n=1 Tax=Azospirillum sp. (strain B510) TaxID=137722 RepID=UPI0001C4BB9A|nr:CHASE2 domain-containing protein [Azospirillum sp. B510]BAI74397.1 hypothetical protein AZL_a08660 [Azospirillum sp. B510]